MSPSRGIALTSNEWFSTSRDSNGDLRKVNLTSHFPLEPPSTYPTPSAMRLNTVVVLAAAFLIGSSVTSAAIQPGQIALSETESVGAALQHDSDAKRSLRSHEPIGDNDDEEDEDEEERELLEKLKFLKWLKKGMNPKKLATKLGLDGLGERARDHPKYQTYLDYSRYWWKNQ